MLIQRFEDSWEITVPAKVNLFLEVIGKRSDGYHELDTVMLGINLCDRICFKSSAKPELALKMRSASHDGFSKLSNEDNAWEISDNRTNLVIRALEAVRQRFGISKGINAELIKGIPAQAGLGGGSADAAAAIVGGMLSWLNRYHEPTAIELASELGSDINFFIEGRAMANDSANWLARCQSRGEHVEPISSNWEFDLVVVHPPLGCSTSEIFRGLDRANDSFETLRPSSGLIQALEARDQKALANSLFNRLEKYAEEVNPWVLRLSKRLKEEQHVLGTCMSGSGSAIYAVVDSSTQSIQLAKQLKAEYPVRAYPVRNWQSPTIIEQLATMNSR